MTFVGHISLSFVPVPCVVEYDEPMVDTHYIGGIEEVGISDVGSCQTACNNKQGCLAIDYNRAELKCFLHMNINLLDDTLRRDLTFVDHYRIISSKCTSKLLQLLLRMLLALLLLQLLLILVVVVAEAIVSAAISNSGININSNILRAVIVAKVDITENC